MRRKKAVGNKRVREGQKLARQRAARQWLHTLRRRLLWTLGIAGVSYACIAVAWFAYTGGFARTAHAVVAGFYAETAHLGFRTTYVYVDGRRETPIADITKAVGVAPNAPILALSISDIRDRLDALPRIRQSSVERVLPDQLYIHVEERIPVAEWQLGGKIHLVDIEGKVMPETHPEKYASLPLIVGEAAPQHVAELLAFLTSEPSLMQNMRAAVMVGGRRWNIRFAGGLELKLPETNAAEAWHKFADLNRDESLMKRDVTMVDMRLTDRIFVKTPPQPKLPAATGPSRET